MPFHDFHTFFLNVAVVMFRTHAQNLLSKHRSGDTCFLIMLWQEYYSSCPTPSPAHLNTRNHPEEWTQTEGLSRTNYLSSHERTTRIKSNLLTRKSTY